MTTQHRTRDKNQEKYLCAGARVFMNNSLGTARVLGLGDNAYQAKLQEAVNEYARARRYASQCQMPLGEIEALDGLMVRALVGHNLEGIALPAILKQEREGRVYTETQGAPQ